MFLEQRSYLLLVYADEVMKTNCLIGWKVLGIKTFQVFSLATVDLRTELRLYSIVAFGFVFY